MLTDLNALSDVTAVTWSPEANSLASGSDDKTVRIWDASTGQCVSTLSGHSRYFDCCFLLLLFSNVWCVLTIEHFTGKS